MWPKPPCFLGVLIQARWVNWLSTDTATISEFRLRNSSILSLKAEAWREDKYYCWNKKKLTNQLFPLDKQKYLKDKTNWILHKVI
jgi:hypothetical protein